MQHVWIIGEHAFTLYGKMHVTTLPLSSFGFSLDSKTPGQATICRGNGHFEVKF